MPEEKEDLKAHHAELTEEDGKINEEMKAPKQRNLTFGERAVGLSFNPSQKPEVKAVKEQYAATIDMLHDLRSKTEDKEVARMFSVAITETQTAQMWAVKAVTWN